MKEAIIETAIFIDPLSDFGYKKLFARESTAGRLKDFINSILQLEKPVIEVALISTEQIGDLKDDRRAVFDLHCKDEAGNYFIIEVQKLKKEHFIDRSLYYSTFPIRSQGEKGQWDFKLKKIFTICLLDFCFDDTHPDEMFHEVRLIEANTQKIFSDRLMLLYIELPKFGKPEHELITRRDKWLFILKNTFELKEIPLSLADDPVFNDFFMDAKKAQLMERELFAYYRGKMAEWDEYAAKETAQKEGMAKGMAEGLTKGMAEGMAKGMAEGFSTTAVNMLKDGVDIELIAKYTGLSLTEIETLAAKTRNQ